MGTLSTTQRTIIHANHSNHPPTESVRASIYTGSRTAFPSSTGDSRERNLAVARPGGRDLSARRYQIFLCGFLELLDRAANRRRSDSDSNLCRNGGRQLRIGWPLNQAIPGPGPLNPRPPLFNKFGLTQSINDASNEGSNSYQALQTKLTKRFSRGLSVLGYIYMV